MTDQTAAVLVPDGGLITERIPYPAEGPSRLFFRLPLLAHRLGFGFIIGQMFLIVTTTGRKSGQPRRAVIEYHRRDDRLYAMVGWRQSDWYRNLLADPRVTIQTARGAERVTARVLSGEEAVQAWLSFEKSPSLRSTLEEAGLEFSEQMYRDHADGFILLTFDPTDEPTPPPQEADLRWVTGLVINLVLTILFRGIVASRVRRRKAAKWADAHGGVV